MEKIGSTYTLGHQIRAIGNSAEKWIKTVVEWQNKERKARTASEAEMAKMVKTKNPLIKLLLPSPDTMPEPQEENVGDVQVEGVEEDEGEEEEELVVKRRRKGKMVVKEDPENEEEQFFMTELDMYVPVEMMEFAMGGTAGHDVQSEGQGELLGLDQFFNVPIMPEVEIAQSANESVQVEVENVQDEARMEEVREREPGALIEREEEAGGNRGEDIRRSPELEASNMIPEQWLNHNIRGRSGVRYRNKPPALKGTPVDEERFRGDAEVRAAYQQLDK